MKYQRKRISRAIRAGLVMGMLATAGIAAAAAQTPTAAAPAATAKTPPKTQPKTLATVVVTGSLIRRVDMATASPVTALGRESITRTGKPILGDVLQQLPMISGNATNTHNNTNGGGVATPATEAGDGAARVSLRGLGTGRTLVLIDGQRMVNEDINLIPQNMVQRVDVLAEGASTTYGSDAVGGVVNFILRRDFKGAEISLNDGISSHGDGQRRGFSLTMGNSGDRYSLVGGLDYNRYDAVPGPRRDFATNQLFLANGKVIVSGSRSIPTGEFQLPSALATRFGCPLATLQTGNGTALDNYRCFQPGVDAFSTLGFDYLQTQQQRTGGFLLGRYNLTPNVTAFLDVFYNHTDAAGLDPAAPVGTEDGLVIPASAPFNPFGVTFSQNVIPGDPDSGYDFQTRLMSAGARLHPYSTHTGQVITGVRGGFGDSWNWNVTLDYGHTARTQRDDNELSIPALQAAIDAGANIFDESANGVALGAGAVDAVYGKYQSLQQIQASANGDLWSLPAGPVQLAVGALYRKDTMHYTVPAFALLDPATANCAILQEACGSPGRGTDSVREAFGEVLIPLLSGLPGAYSLNLDLGARWSNYASTPGSTTNKKVALEWRPIQDLLVRGTISQVFRAPNLDQLYDGRSILNPTVTDPCVFLTAAELAQHTAACRFVPPNWAGSGTLQPDTYYSGAKAVGEQLRPEHGKSVDIGFVYQPRRVPGLNTSLDFWHIYLYDTLAPVAGTTVLNACFADNSSPFCPLIDRQSDATRRPGRIFVIDTPVVNLGTLSTSGADFTLNYAIPHFRVHGIDPGHFKVGLDTTYTSTFKNNAAAGLAGSQTLNYAGTLGAQFGNIARWRAALTVDWQRNQWDAQWRTRYIAPVTALAADSVTNANLPMASVVYTDLQVGYAVPTIHTRFDVGVDNLTDRKPPLWYQNGQVNTDTATYDVMGRYYWARATLRF
ncbi:MAG: TonB-dependent receptor [Rhodanobacteraceae bacterium]|nr:MAG: TonB-dependent receptor [Rhodanobacteraceae bacterium]